MKKFSIQALIFVIGVMIVIGYKVIFVDQNEVGDFNDQIVEQIKKPESKHKPFLELLNDYAAKKTVDLSKLADLRDGLEEALKNSRDSLKKIEIPEDENDLCKEFHTAAADYTNSSLELAKKYEEVVDYISSDHNPGNEKDVKHINGLFVDLMDKTEKLFDKVADLQEKTAKEFDIKLK